MSDLPLVGERVVVRRFRSGDALAFRRYRDDPGTAAFQGWEVPYSDALAEAFVAWAADAPLGQPNTWCQLAVEAVGGPELAGDVGVHTLGDRPAIVELGVTLAPEARSRGLAAEAIELVCDHLVASCGTRSAIALVLVENAPSTRLFERLGFTLVGTWPGDDGLLEHRYERRLDTAPDP